MNNERRRLGVPVIRTECAGKEKHMLELCSKPQTDVETCSQLQLHQLISKASQRSWAKVRVATDSIRACAHSAPELNQFWERLYCWHQVTATKCLTYRRVNTSVLPSSSTHTEHQKKINTTLKEELPWNQIYLSFFLFFFLLLPKCSITTRITFLYSNKNTSGKKSVYMLSYTYIIISYKSTTWRSVSQPALLWPQCRRCRAPFHKATGTAQPAPLL